MAEESEVRPSEDAASAPQSGARAAAALSAAVEKEEAEGAPAAAAGDGGEPEAQAQTNGAASGAAQEETAAAAPEEPEAQPVAKPAQTPQSRAAELQAQAAEAKRRATDELFNTARLPNFTKVLMILDEHPDLWTAVDESSHSLLHWAALVGNVDFARAAVAKGCNVNALAANKQTPLMWALTRGHLSTARTLCALKAEVSHSDSLGATPLMIAVQHRMHPCMLLMLKRGGESLLKDADKNGCTAVHWAAYKGDLVSLRVLEYFGADLHAIDGKGMLPMHRATSAGQANVVEFLLSKKSDPMMRNKDGQTCLDIAEKSNEASIQAMIKRSIAGKAPKDLEAAPAELMKDGGEEKPQGLKEQIFQSLSKDKAGQKFFPVFWIVCVALSMFQYLTELRATSYSVAPTASMLFELGVPASLMLFAWVALGDPGKIPTGIKGKSGLEDLMRKFDTDGSEIAEAQVQFSRLCLTTWVLKDLRTKYCTQTGACVSEFDHYCVWLNTAIGRGNHRQFVFLAVTEAFTQAVHIYLCWSMAWALVPYKGATSWLFGVWVMYPLLGFMFVIQCLTVPWVCVLIGHQVRLVVQNLTTNEMMNMHRYDHFWETQMVEPGRLMRVFTNPFHKGSAWKNCVDFWWDRKRSDKGVGYTAKPCCDHGHNHSRG